MTDIPIRIYEVAAKEQLSVFEVEFAAPLNNEISGYLLFEEKKIVLNAADSAKRRRFTIAHEIGHFLMHEQQLRTNPDIGIVYRTTLSSKDPREQEANYFAANLLMPALAVSQYYTPDFPLERLAAIFAVSEDAMKYRIQSLTIDGVL